jgi:hypothetical protein
MLRRLAAPAIAVLLCACASGAPGTGPSAVARLLPVRASGAQGGVELVRADGVLRVFGAVRGLAPNAQYLLQVEDAGCDDAADPPVPPPESGAKRVPVDLRLPNLHADATGTATFSFDVRTPPPGGPAGLADRGIAVLARPDGASGAPGGRLACGTIRPR